MSTAPPRVGRNEPCPCRSGRKYKKCCGGPSPVERRGAVFFASSVAPAVAFYRGKAPASWLRVVGGFVVHRLVGTPPG